MSDIEPQTEIPGQTGSENSVGRGNAAMKAPYATVAKAFEGFQQPLGKHGFLARGGQRRDDKNPRIPSEAPGYQAPDYHVESSFTDEQRIYIGATIAALNTLAQGRNIARNDSPIQSFSARIEDHFRSQSLSEASFSNAVTASTLDLFTAFGEFYPNLIPALDAMSSVAGIQGTDTAVRHTFCFLVEAIKKEFDRSNAKAHHRHFTSSDNFLGRYPKITGTPDQYEVWCSGEAFAKTLIRQAKDAALHLAEDSTVQSKYNSKFDTSLNSGLGLSRSLKNRISQVVGQITQQYSPKVIV